MREEITEQEETDAADAKQAADLDENPARRDPKNAKLLCLQNGDMETLLGLSFGEPDEAGEYDKVDSIETVIWHFDKASLEVRVRNGYISSMEYLAADGVADGVEIPWEETDFAKGSQGNYDYLENIYQWVAICGSDANDTEASYHPSTCAYDEKGRMILNDYYITHGGHTNIFVYKDDSDLPWACLNWCSYTPGFTNVYLFR